MAALAAAAPDISAGPVTEAWVQRYGGSAHRDDRARAVVVDPQGNVIVTGFASYVSTNNYRGWESDIYTAKYAAADGTLIWEKRNQDPSGVYDEGKAMAVDANGDVIVAGISYLGSTNADFYTAKYAGTDGALIWERRYNGPANGDDKAQAVVVDASGNVVVTGSSTGSGGAKFDYYTAKYAATDGTLLWEVRYNGGVSSLDQASGIAVDAEGNVVVTGTSNFDYYTARYAGADGALIWERRYSGTSVWGGDEARAVAVDTSGNVVVTGYSRGSGSAVGNHNDSDIYTVKYAAADGAVIWEKRYDGPIKQVDGGTAVAIDSSGNVVVAGISQSVPNTYGDRYTAKYAGADGALLWEQRNGSFSQFDQAGAIALDFNGNVVVAGIALIGGDLFAAKYESRKGTQLWEKRYSFIRKQSGPGADLETPGCLAIGPGGAVVITGASYNGVETVMGISYGNFNYATVKYLDPVTLITPLPNNGGYQLQFPSNPGNQYVVQRASVVAGPWTTLTTVTAPASGYILYTDANPPPGAGFYRLLPL